MSTPGSALDDAQRLTLSALQDAVRSAAAFRCRRVLQPAGGSGDKVFPPTFMGAVYAVERRRLPDRAEPVACVVLDTVQSQANRMEQALQDALDAGKLTMPLVEVDFSKVDPTAEGPRKDGLIEAVGRVTSLQAPHRLADAILRDSEAVAEDGSRTAFRQTAAGRAVGEASYQNATPLFEYCPTALIFGMWDSTGPKGGLGAKFERAIVSEIVGIGAETPENQSRGVRRDPLQIRSQAGIVLAADKSWQPANEQTKKPEKPSEINHGNVVLPEALSGATVEYAEQATTLSLICLRRLCFPVAGEKNGARDLAARTVLAALGLAAAALAIEGGAALRSRCLLWPEAPPTWELLDQPGQTPRCYRIGADDALGLLSEAINLATAAPANLPWPAAPVKLEPSANLVTIVRRSQELSVTEPSE